MTNNARAYNRPDSEYVACASRVDAFVAARVRALAASLAAGGGGGGGGASAPHA